MSENTMLCPSCGKEVELNGAAFCPFCGAPLKEKPRKAEEDPEIFREIAKLTALPTPQAKNEMMEKLLAKYPDSLAVNEEKLFLVRIPEKRRRAADFSVIKSYLLHFYLTPDDFSEEKKDAMRREIFSHPQLSRCIELSGDENGFMNHYLERLCKEFVELFVHGSTYYSRTLFGIKLESRMDRYLAAPVCKMMKEVNADEALTSDQRRMLYGALYRGFQKDVGNTAHLDALLAEHELPMPEHA